MECPCGEYTVKDELTKHAPFNMYESNYVDFAPVGLQEANVVCNSCKYRVEGSMYKHEYEPEYEPKMSLGLEREEIEQNHCHVMHTYINKAGLCRFWGSKTQSLSQEAETTQQEDIRLELEIAHSKIMEEVSESK